VGQPTTSCSANELLTAERDHLDRARACLVHMRDVADRIADYGVDALASEGLGRLRAERMKHLSEDGDAPPFFGRTDRDPDAGHPSGETFHIGRRHVRDEVGDPVVIDWRAPIARPFYRATPQDRLGVRMRRRFGFSGIQLTSFEDEHLDVGESLGLSSDLLRAEIERPRVGPMRDIVATIQPDQDELVRADLDTSICVQGAPGTGKTAVGLHRAAYLLYTYPERLRRSGVLVVGPNAAFLRYIAQVLPALGESGIEQSTVHQLVARIPARKADPVEVAILKGDVRMAAILRRAVFSYIAKPDQDVVAIVGTKRYRISADRLRRFVDDTRRALTAGELKWDTARERLRQLLAHEVRRQREDSGGAPSDAETNQVARSVQVRDCVDRAWPALKPQALLRRLYTEPDFAQRCVGSALSAQEVGLLSWPTVAGDKKPRNTGAFSVADQVLLDELAGLISGNDSYVHVVVDEAQDLSAMQCRAVARRCRIGSVTVLGDLAQATTPWAVGSWQATMTHLGRPTTEIKPLTIGYRVPGEVLEVANRLLPHIAADVPPASSVRAGGDALTYSPDLLPSVHRCLEVEGSVGVIVADADAQATLSQIRDAGVDARMLTDDEPSRVTVVPATAAKGLEYDSVILIEPADIVAVESSRLGGLRTLYVAWTRAVSRLSVVHCQPLPVELAAAGGR
jgi:DNA helicase IV